MTITSTYPAQLAYVPQRAGTLYDVLELILDRGMVIDVFVRVSLVGIEILKIDARVVVASVDTYLRFAEACNRLDLEGDTRSTTVPELFGGGGAGGVGGKVAKKAVASAGRKVKEAVTGDSQEEESEEREESGGSRRTSEGSGKARRKVSR
jgi:hypothetical protein